MSRRSAPLGAYLLLISAASASVQRLSLENEHLRLTLQVEGKSAGYEELFAKAQGRNLLAPAPALGRIPAFQIDVYKDGKPKTVDPAQADHLELSKLDSHTLVLKADFRAYGLTARQKVSLRPGSPAAEITMDFRIEAAGYRIGIARFPGVGFPADAGPGTAILLPVADGLTVENPGALMADGEKRSFNYPGMASAQVMAAYDQQGGMVAYAADGKGDFKLLTVRKHGKHVFLLFEAVLYHLDPPSVEMPYAVRLGVFQGGWERAADIYKAWALNQSWCAKNLRNRRLPKALANTSFSLGVNLREGLAAAATDRSPKIPGLVRGWSRGLGMPVNAVLLSWERHGPWIAPEYFPPYGGDDAFNKLIRDIHADGNQTTAFLSGFNVTLDKTARNGAPAYRADAALIASLEASAIAGPDGKPFLEGKAAEGTGRRATLCPSTTQARSAVAEAFRKLRGYGVDRIQIDQVVGGGVSPCFSTAHGHAVVGGNHMYRSISGLLDSMARMDDSAVIMLEEPGELYIPHAHAFHTREYMEGHWPRDGKGVKGVPLFAYLYHEFALGYGGDSAPICEQGGDPTLAIYAQAANLIHGRTPAAAAWMRLVPFDRVEKRQRRFMQETARLWTGPAGEFLRYGTMLTLDQQAFKGLTVKGSVSGSRFDFRTRNLLASGYGLPDGRAGIGYINLTGKPLQSNLKYAAGRGRIAKDARILASADPGIALYAASDKSPGKVDKRVKSGETYKFPPFGFLFMEARQ